MTPVIQVLMVAESHFLVDKYIPISAFEYRKIDKIIEHIADRHL